jgi:hypothetical protein
MRHKIEESGITREKVVGMALDALSAAKADGALIAQLRALQLLARLHGYLGNKRNERVIRSFDDLTDEELQSLERQ